MTRKGNHEIIGWWFSRLVQFVHPDVPVMLCAEQLKILKVYFPWKLLRQWTQICLDDCVKSMTDGNSAIFHVPKLWELLSKGGFNLTKWVSNSLHALATTPESESANPVKDLHLGDMPSQRALGIKWNLELDTFGFRVKVKQKLPTRRSILSVVSSVYDPLCCRALKWDEEVPDEHLKNRQQWLHDRPRLVEFCR